MSGDRSVKFLAPRVGFEPTTLRLTAECSTIELPRSNGAGVLKPLKQRRWTVSIFGRPIVLARFASGRPWCSDCGSKFVNLPVICEC